MAPVLSPDERKRAIPFLRDGEGHDRAVFETLDEGGRRSSADTPGLSVRGFVRLAWSMTW